MTPQTAVLNCILRKGGEVYNEVAHKLSIDFFSELNREIYKSIKTLGDKEQPIDVYTVTEELKAHDLPKNVSASDVVELAANDMLFPERIEYYIGQLQGEYLNKRIQKNARLVMQDPQNANEYLDKIKEYKNKLRETEEEIKPFFDNLRATMKEIEELKATDGFPGLSTGLSCLDHALLGYQRGTYYVIAGRPQEGKTALSLHSALHLIKQNKSVLFITLEQPENQLVMRLLANESEIDGRRIQSGNLSEHDFKKLTQGAIKRVTGKQLYLFRPNDINIDSILNKSKELMKRTTIDIVFLDYIQLVYSGEGANRNQKIGAISRKLRKFCLDESIPIIVVSQLSRAVEKRGVNAEPILSDLRDSGEIEQDADVIMFIYHKNKNDDDIQTIGIAKHKNGPTTKLNVIFKKKFLKFKDMSN